MLHLCCERLTKNAWRWHVSVLTANQGCCDDKQQNSPDWLHGIPTIPTQRTMNRLWTHGANKHQLTDSTGGVFILQVTILTTQGKYLYDRIMDRGVSSEIRIPSKIIRNTECKNMCIATDSEKEYTFWHKLWFTPHVFPPTFPNISLSASSGLIQGEFQGNLTIKFSLFYTDDNQW